MGEGAAQREGRTELRMHVEMEGCTTRRWFGAGREKKGGKSWEVLRVYLDLVFPGAPAGLLKDLKD